MSCEFPKKSIKFCNILRHKKTSLKMAIKISITCSHTSLHDIHFHKFYHACVLHTNRHHRYRHGFATTHRIKKSFTLPTCHDPCLWLISSPLKISCFLFWPFHVGFNVILLLHIFNTSKKHAYWHIIDFKSIQKRDIKLNELSWH